MGVVTTKKSKTVGPELAAVLPQDGQPWYKNRGILKLNFCILSVVMFCKKAPLGFSEHLLIAHFQPLPTDMMDP
jgi:hypothetical protein